MTPKLMTVALACALLGLGACAEAWRDADRRAATNQANGASAVLTMCAPDAGTCIASQVRGVETMQYCSAASQLVAHDAAVPPADLGPDGRCR